MTDPESSTTRRIDAGAYTLLQQQLVSVRARLDRQVGQLIRLNRISDELLHTDEDTPLAQFFAEAIVDILDVAVGAVWIFGDDTEPVEFTVFGTPDSGWSTAGAKIAQRLSDNRAVPLAPELRDLLPGPVLVDPIVCRAAGSATNPRALLIASNTTSMAGMYEPSATETLEILTLIAEKLSAHMAVLADRRVIAEQVVMLRDSEERLGLVLKGTNDGWWDWELTAGTCLVSQRWLQMLGLEAGDVQAHDGFWWDRVHTEDLPAFRTDLETALTEDASGLEAEIRMRHRDGTYLPVLVRGTITRSSGGEPIRFTGSIFDLSERHRQESQVRRLAFFDPLTDLPNRRMLISRIEDTLRVNSQTGAIAAVLMLDLDRFKTLNDTHGHAAGDQLLRIAAHRLHAEVRGADTVARLSGDEFVALLPSAGDDVPGAVRSAELVAERLQQALTRPFELDAGTIHLSTSIGIALAAGSSATVDDVLKQADVAMYEAKAAGRNAVRVFKLAMQMQLEQRARFDARLREGFAAGELELHYQPQVDVDGRLYGTEALLRWYPPDLGPVAPAEIITAAEDSGFIHELGQWALETVCRQAALWGSGPDSRIAVNLSSAEFLHPDFPQRVLAVLERTGVSGKAIRLEITEATVVSDVEFAASRMETLMAHGIEFSADDFGTGYSSLTYLRGLPFSEVKIDRSYAARLPDDPQDVAIVQAIMSLCQTLGLRIVAEGVETSAQLEALSRYGAEIFQGHLFGGPQPPPAKPQDLVQRRPTV
ncbi:MAG: EAL domain-containing protein [Actinobacteria bacterium]|nr:EAL domain-containing protein [Actinomycetota bacterium]MCB8998334.1 EAL domain-containing protein [Actinomycetota bacterium]MCB9415459.1 EAL domain-containing protein [Actinomycetota bacterium]HRY10968.1 EAL domain-containing protein [Candidatus Nanopelagicales bacterium]